MSKAYTVKLFELVKTSYYVYADSPEEAIRKAKEGDYILNYGIAIEDHLGVDETYTGEVKEINHG